MQTVVNLEGLKMTAHMGPGLVAPSSHGLYSGVTIFFLRSEILRRAGQEMSYCLSLLGSYHP